MSEQITDSPSEWVAEHTRRYVETGGQEGHEWQAGVTTLLLTTTGRTTGIRRRTALIYGRDGADATDPTDQTRARLVVVASKGGAPEHPQWYQNLAANPLVEVQVLDETFTARAQTVTGSERERLWATMRQIWPAYDDYATKTERQIPVVVLTRTT